MQPNDRLAWYVFGPECGKMPLIVEFLMEMGGTDTSQIRMPNKVCLIVPTKLLQHFTVITDAK